MNSLVNLMSMIGVERTLIIACADYEPESYLEFDGRVFIYFLPARTLHGHDSFERERIRTIIEDMECTQVVFVGTMDASMRERIHNSNAMQSLRAALRFNLGNLLRNREHEIVPESRKDQLLLELHVITQCTLLMDYYFIRERTEKKQLTVRGIVAYVREEHLKPVFHNGIKYNDIISMN